MFSAAFISGCSNSTAPEINDASAELSPFWRNATIYFLMTDRFANGDPSNDTPVGRAKDAGLLRGFEGGDIQGVIDKIEAGYFEALGVDAIWTTPLIENVHGAIVENEFGRTYSYHGYWPKDWTAIDPNFGDEADFARMVNAAHANGLRVIVDVIVNHAGAPTSIDPVWPETWVRRGPTCSYDSYANNVPCEMSFTLQDILTESEADTPLPDFIIEKWRNEGRLEQEIAELDAFFTRTGYPRAPKYYIIKWLTDWVREYGVDGFRVDTAKHTEAEVWSVLKVESELALQDWRARNPGRSPGGEPFFMFGEVFNYGVNGFSNAASEGRAYDYGDRQVDFFNYGFDALINMGFPTHAKQPMSQLFALYSDEFERGDFRGVGMVNYVTSHDDMAPFDPTREKAYESANKLMLAPGAVQIYYGDEIGRDLTIEGAIGDATLRSFMQWDQLGEPQNRALLDHWRMLGKFRQRHTSIGAGAHEVIQESPFTFSRRLQSGTTDDAVVVAVDLGSGRNTIRVAPVFSDGSSVRDAASGAVGVVANGVFTFDTKASIALIELVDK